MTILLATNNAHKVDELQSVLRRTLADLQIVRPADIGLALDVEEDAMTLEGNAYRKAIAFHHASGMACIADDTGLEVDALNGAPGVHSARFAGPEASYNENCELLLQKLEQIPDDNRRARFRTILCFVDSHRTEFAEGMCAGHILGEGRGTAGFGYDPLFVPDGYEHSFAEMSADQKNAISHRGRALQALAERFAEYRDPESAQSAKAHRALNNGSKAEHGQPIRRWLCEAAVLALRQNNEQLREFLDRYTREHHDVGQMYEALLQIYLFAGFPAALEALTTLRSVVNSEGQAWYAEDDEAYDLREFQRRGTETCQRIYTSVYTAMRERVSQLSSHLDTWMIIEGYGKVLSRPRLDIVSRELVSVAVLAYSGWERQLLSHLRGALNVGATADDCEMALDCAARHSSELGSLRARAVWQRLQVSTKNS